MQHIETGVIFDMSAKVDNTLFDPESILAPVTSGHGDEIDRVKAAEQLLHEAEEATASEHRMGLWQGLKTYPKASAWSIAISFAVVMEGESELCGDIC